MHRAHYHTQQSDSAVCSPASQLWSGCCEMGDLWKLCGSSQLWEEIGEMRELVGVGGGAVCKFLISATIMCLRLWLLCGGVGARLLNIFEWWCGEIGNRGAWVGIHLSINQRLIGRPIIFHVISCTARKQRHQHQTQRFAKTRSQYTNSRPFKWRANCPFLFERHFSIMGEIAVVCRLRDLSDLGVRGLMALNTLMGSHTYSLLFITSPPLLPSFAQLLP